jgi:hypothetical protein
MYQGSYQNADYSDDDAQFQRLAQSLGANIQKILQNVSKIQRMISQVGTPQVENDFQSVKRFQT